MSSNSNLSVLIIGATGTLGSAITRGFQLPQYASQVKLSLLVRKDTAETAGPKKDALDSYVKNGATLVYGDITQSEAELTKTFSGFNVIISAVGAMQLGEQLKLIPAAKAAGVRWFVPSAFGVDSAGVGTGSPLPFIDLKLTIDAALKSSGLDYTIFSTGMFSEYTLSPDFFGVDAANAKVTAPGSFSTTVNTTPLTDIGITVADVITSGKGKNQTVFTGVPVSYEQIAVGIEKVTGKKVTRVTRSVAESEVAILQNPHDFVARFAVLLGKQGPGLTWPVSETYAVKNGLTIPSYEEFIKKAISQ